MAAYYIKSYLMSTNHPPPIEIYLENKTSPRNLWLHIHNLPRSDCVYVCAWCRYCATIGVVFRSVCQCFGESGFYVYICVRWRWLVLELRDLCKRIRTYGYWRVGLWLGMLLWWPMAVFTIKTPSNNFTYAHILHAFLWHHHHHHKIRNNRCACCA